ncbi:HDOD domain family [Verrucomicrobiia bacterium DG1235]|nr:HDOD domain family [Verrucomicrobiae bacterium DG1235]
MRERILFVDDETNVLQGLRRSLRKKRSEWDFHFEDSGKKALALLAETPVDIIVSDMQMPSMDGAEFLDQASKRFPNTIRIILSGYTDQETILRTIGPAHQYLAKPCNHNVLIDTIQRSLDLRRMLDSDSLRSLVSGLETLPTPSGVFNELISELSSEKASSDKVVEIIETDVSLTANILKLTNSAYFGLATNHASPLQAVQQLGLETLKAIVLIAGTFQAFEGDAAVSSAITTLGERSLAIGMLSKAIAYSLKLDKRLVDQAYIGGTLSHVGTLLLLSKQQKAFRNVIDIIEQEQLSIIEAEKKALGATHSEIGAYLLGLWGFIDPIIEAVAHHHEPAHCSFSEITPLTCVHIAQELTRPGHQNDNSFGRLDETYLEKLGIADQLPNWRKIAEKLR